jgi:hypothetical protein
MAGAQTPVTRLALAKPTAWISWCLLGMRVQGRRGLEVAHQQIRFAEHDLAFCARIGAQGDLVVELNGEDPRLSERLFLEEELQRASKFVGWNSRR